MRLSTKVSPALNAGQKTESALLVEVTGRDPIAETDWNEWKQIAAQWAERLVKETRAKAHWSSTEDEEPDRPQGWTPAKRLRWLKSAGLEVLVNGAPINHLSLKQFRDADDPSRACFQAINLYPEAITRINDMRELDQRLHVAVHRYPSQPIVEKLGLLVKWTDASQGQPIDYLQPIRPFWLTGDMVADLGQDVLWRSGSEEWHEGQAPKLYFDPERLQEPAPPANGAQWVDRNPQGIQDFRTEHVASLVTIEAHMEWPGGGSWWKSRDVHRMFLSKPRVSFSPQVALESMLSKRWLNFDKIMEPEEEQDADKLPDSLVRKDSIAHPEVRKGFESYQELEPSDGDHWILPAKQVPEED